MSSDKTENSSESENICVVCFKNVDIYSIGVCDHPVCFECSTRMRVLCRQNECPICRQDMPKVVFTKDVQPFSTLKGTLEQTSLLDRKFGIYFTSPNTQKAYYRLLEHNCPICPESERKWPFKTFHQLKDHMRREHELFYCDLCVDNLKIFSFERRCYTRQELGQHRRKGDSDNTSHRGHPLCEFCDTRYMDSDELFRHLRREHYYCHFCDADGKHEFYNSYDDLRKHFHEEHYLCEEGECKNEKFTSAFRTDIDLKAHIASVHSRNLSKAATRQARTLELEFTVARYRPDKNKRRNNDRGDDAEGAVGFDNHYMEPGGPSRNRENQERTFVNSLDSNNFPSLGGTSSNSSSHARPQSSVIVTKVPGRYPFSGEDFPSLGGTSSSNKPQTALGKDFSKLRENTGYRAPEVTITSRPIKGSSKGFVRNEQNFPALGEPSTSVTSGTSTLRLSVNNTQDRQQHSKVPNVSIQVEHKPNGAITTSIRTGSTSSTQSYHSKDDFPALSSSRPPSDAQWVQLKPKKAEPKQNKVAPAPVLPPRDDFPSLSKKKPNKTSSVTVPVNNGVKSERVEDKVKNSVKNNKASPGSSKNASGSSVTEAVDPKTKTKKKKVKSERSASETIENQNNTINISNDLPNGLVKKRSELKIETLKAEQNTVVKPEDFPALGQPNPPPGFTVKPPPGFSNFGVQNCTPNNDLTFTNSTGRSYAIRPITNYHQPENFSMRNRNLIERFMSILNNNEAIKEFKEYSDLFRSGILPAVRYYEHCKCFLGDEFGEVFPELLVLLPDVEKQQELYKVHASEGCVKGLVVCDVCQQVVLEKELDAHNSYHCMKDDFPALGKPWKK